MACNPRCVFFPDVNCTKFIIDEEGIKRRKEETPYICGYDGHIIKNWNEECPKEKDGFSDANEIRKHLVDFANTQL